MWNLILKLFEKSLWKEINREFLRQERESDSSYYLCDTFDIYAVTYKDLKSDKIKIEEVKVLS